MANQALDEQESTFTIEATNRNQLRVFSNDVVWQRRVEALGIEPVKTSEYGKFYAVDLSQFSFGIRRKRQMSDEQRAAAAERLAAYRDQDDDDDSADE